MIIASYGRNGCHGVLLIVFTREMDGARNVCGNTVRIGDFVSDGKIGKLD